MLNHKAHNIMLTFSPTPEEIAKIIAHLKAQDLQTLNTWKTSCEQLGKYAKHMGKRRIKWDPSKPGETGIKVAMACDQAIKLINQEIQSRQ